jgi:hypothetical protein
MLVRVQEVVARSMMNFKNRASMPMVRKLLAQCVLMTGARALLKLGKKWPRVMR